LFVKDDLSHIRNSYGIVGSFLVNRLAASDLQELDRLARRNAGIPNLANSLIGFALLMSEPRLLSQVFVALSRLGKNLSGVQWSFIMTIGITCGASLYRG
jgi:hypothetical protein